MLLTLLIIIVPLVLIILYVIAIYNGLVRKQKETENAWSQIDVQLTRRGDLIPNLVETVKGYATHEKSTLEDVIKARAAATQIKIEPKDLSDAAKMAQFTQAQDGLSASLGRLLVAMEQYPDLKANQNFLSLQEELTTTENRIAFSRQFYNDTAMQFNTKIDLFPSNIVANMFNFKPVAYFEAEEEKKEVPKVQF